MFGILHNGLEHIMRRGQLLTNGLVEEPHRNRFSGDVANDKDAVDQPRAPGSQLALPGVQATRRPTGFNLHSESGLH